MACLRNLFVNRCLLMRKVIISSVLIVFCSLLTYLISGIVIKAGKNKQAEIAISTLPSFSLLNLKGESFNSDELERGPVLIVKFHPECEHCQYEIEGILNSPIPMSDAHILLVSSANQDTIRKFMLQFEGKISSNIITLIDTAWLFTEIFGNSAVPTNYIYDRSLKLVKVMPGEVKTETIIKYLLKIE